MLLGTPSTKDACCSFLHQQKDGPQSSLALLRLNLNQCVYASKCPGPSSLCKLWAVIAAPALTMNALATAVQVSTNAGPACAEQGTAC